MFAFQKIFFPRAKIQSVGSFDFFFRSKFEISQALFFVRAPSSRKNSQSGFSCFSCSLTPLIVVFSSTPLVGCCCYSLRRVSCFNCAVSRVLTPFFLLTVSQLVNRNPFY